MSSQYHLSFWQVLQTRCLFAYIQYTDKKGEFILFAIMKKVEIWNKAVLVLLVGGGSIYIHFVKKKLQHTSRMNWI